MTVAFDRRAIVTVDTVRISSTSARGGAYAALRVAFEVTKTSKPEPNKATVKIWNLSPAHVRQLEQAKYPAVQIEAGYADSTGVIFLGKLRAGSTVRDGGDLITTLESGDGEKELQTARVNLSIVKGTTADDVLRSLVAYLGVSPGNVNDAARKVRAAFSGSGNVFSMGTVLSGSASREMTAICRSLGLEWSVQDGKLQILERTKSLERTAIRLTPKTGMIGEPTFDAKGVLEVTSVLQADAFPGRAVVVEGARVTAQVRIEEVVHTGDTFDPGAEWTSKIKGKRY